MAANFAADNDRVTHNSVALGTILDGTLFFLFYPTDAAARQYLGAKIGADDWNITWRADLAGDNFEGYRHRATTYINAFASAASFAAYALNSWMFICFRWATGGVAGDQKLLMGNLDRPLAEPSAYVAQSLGTGTPGVTNADFYIGNGGVTTREFHGRIAWTGVWSRPLAPDEANDVRAMFLPDSPEQDPRAIPGNVLWTYPGFLDVTSPQIDYSGYGAHGVVTGATKVEDTYRLVKPPGYRRPKTIFIPDTAGAAFNPAWARASNVMIQVSQT